MTTPLVIVGAGVAGLALGIALKRAGVDAVVLERRTDLPDEGAGIQIGPNGTRMLRALGLYDALEPHARAPEAILVHDGATGRALTQLPLGRWIAERHGAPYWVVHRRDMVLELFRAAREAGVEVRFSVDVSGLSEVADGVRVDLADGSYVSASGVVGADGLWSQIRRSAFGQSNPVPNGRVAARALLTGAAMGAFRRDAVSVWMARDAHLVIYPLQRGPALNVVLISHGIEAEPRWSSPISPDDMMARFQPFAAPLRALHDTADGWRQWPLMSVPPLAAYARGRVALVGDAAHPMQPFLAQGAVMALEDAVVLSQQLTRANSAVAPAFAAYASARRSRTQRVVAAAERNGKVYHLSGVMAAARNAALGVAPGTIVMSGYDWLYGHAADVAV